MAAHFSTRFSVGSLLAVAIGNPSAQRQRGVTHEVAPTRPVSFRGFSGLRPAARYRHDVSLCMGLLSNDLAIVSRGRLAGQITGDLAISRSRHHESRPVCPGESPPPSASSVLSSPKAWRG